MSCFLNTFPGDEDGMGPEVRNSLPSFQLKSMNAGARKSPFMKLFFWERPRAGSAKVNLTPFCSGG